MVVIALCTFYDVHQTSVHRFPRLKKYNDNFLFITFCFQRGLHHFQRIIISELHESMMQLYITKYIPMLSLRVFNNLYILEISEKYLLETLFKDSLKVIITLRKSNRRF